ncbi:MAG: hypothetical protein QOF25_26 [Mycobacterium sp.]|nr:hypothetical protein [Mycobacterium sp.]
MSARRVGYRRYVVGGAKAWGGNPNVERSLDNDEQAEMRSMSTRAEITAIRFVNEYHWGAFRGEPNVVMESPLLRRAPVFGRLGHAG